jgi:light-regulated signal transduction histidine kinase (bacteriophytochrome)
LELANQELDAFSYSVSHDLRAPLRAIEGLACILHEEYASTLPPGATSLLRDMRINAQRMGQLITDLLDFSRVGRQTIRKRKVITKDLVDECLQELRPEWHERSVDISVGELPECQADRGLLGQVWMNLLSNAIKYTGKSRTAVIEIGCRIEDRAPPVYFVKDNGVGFAMEFASKLFGVFQRMHLSEDFEGTGVGLAIAQRIVHRHGGRIWAESQPDLGATFFFTLES